MRLIEAVPTTAGPGARSYRVPSPLVRSSGADAGRRASMYRAIRHTLRGAFLGWQRYEVPAGTLRGSVAAAQGHRAPRRQGRFHVEHRLPETSEAELEGGKPVVSPEQQSDRNLRE